jgi:hypothetical protein
VSVTQDLRPIVAKKASFELACDASTLTIAEISDSSVSNMAGTANTKTFGVQGCGKRASYRAYCVKAMMQSEVCEATQETVTNAAEEPRSSK